MKLKHRVYFIAVIVFMLVISYLILEPELRSTKDNEYSILDAGVDENALNIGLNVGDGSLFVPHVGFVPRNLPEIENPEEELNNAIKKQLLIDKYISMYGVDWSLDIEGDPWKLADSWVTTRQIHSDQASQLGGVLKALSEAVILSADVGFKGTQLKLTVMLSGGRKASFKPKWYSRDHVIYGKPYDGGDRHNGEIASYHLQRLLGYNRAPIAVGRTLDLDKDILPVAETKLRETFFKNDSNTCFLGVCRFCRTKEDAVCADGSMLEGVLVLWLPSQAAFKMWRSPWQRIYNHNAGLGKARWELEDNFCDSVRNHTPYDSGPRLMDLIDTIVFDYLIGNADRHHYETFTRDPQSIIVMFDNGKSFGNAFHDEHTILAPLYQCCQIRKQTFERFQDLQDGVLSSVLRHIMSRDPIAPVLHESHYVAMDARVITVLTEVQKCIAKHGEQYVLVEDYYTGKPVS